MSLPGSSPRFRPDPAAEQRALALRLGALCRPAPRPAPPSVLEMPVPEPPSRPAARPRKAPRPPARPPLPATADVVAAYRQHRSLRGAARACGISHETARTMLNVAGEPLRRWGGPERPPAPSDLPRLVEAYRRLGCIEVAAAECRIGIRRARALLRAEGFGRGGRRPLPDHLLIAAFQRLGSVTVMKRALCLSAATLRRRLLAAGVDLRRRRAE